MLLKTQILINTLVNFVAITILVADAAEGAIIVVSDDLIIEEIVEIIFPSLDISLMPPMVWLSGDTLCRPQHHNSINNVQQPLLHDRASFPFRL